MDFKGFFGDSSKILSRFFSFSRGNRLFHRIFKNLKIFWGFFGDSLKILRDSWKILWRFSSFSMETAHLDDFFGDFRLILCVVAWKCGSATAVVQPIKATNEISRLNHQKIKLNQKIEFLFPVADASTRSPHSSHSRID